MLHVGVAVMQRLCDSICAPFHCNVTGTVIFFLIVLPGPLPSNVASTFNLLQFIHLSLRFFLMWAIFKVFIKFITILLLFYGFIFVHTPCEILAPH